jgi:hypothetical protein
VHDKEAWAGGGQGAVPVLVVGTHVDQAPGPAAAAAAAQLADSLGAASVALNARAAPLNAADARVFATFLARVTQPRRH